MLRLLVLVGILAIPSPIDAAGPNSICGIGVVATTDDPPVNLYGQAPEATVKDHLVVDYTIPGGPGALVGLQKGDEITQIEDRKVAGMKLRAALGLIRGPVGTTVALTIVRQGVAQPFVLTVARELLKVPANK